MKKLFQILFVIVGAVVAIIIFSPKPTTMLIRRLFEGGVAIKPLHYGEIEPHVHVEKDISYNSKYRQGYFDIIQPKEQQGKLPVIFWVHGGAFVAGDKSDITEYAVQVANEGYVIVNMNYDLAPSATYPTPLYQLAEAYQFAATHAEQYGIDLDRVYFAGDSAGAQIVSQFVNIQVDAAYAQMVDLEPVVAAECMKGVLLFCGPYDVARLSNNSDSALINFMFKRVGWAYIGERQWTRSEKVRQASIIDHISPNYPPVFITDGNTGSFEDQGKDLAAKLTQYGVPVSAIFYDVQEATLGHEYQFMMNTPQAEQTFQAAVQFLHDTNI